MVIVLHFCGHSRASMRKIYQKVDLERKNIQKVVDIYAFRVYSIHCQQELTNKNASASGKRKAGAVTQKQNVERKEK